MRISDWSSDVCSSDLNPAPQLLRRMRFEPYRVDARKLAHEGKDRDVTEPSRAASEIILVGEPRIELKEHVQTGGAMHQRLDPEEHTSELQSLMRISYAVFCLKKKKTHKYKYRQ